MAFNYAFSTTPIPAVCTNDPPIMAMMNCPDDALTLTPDMTAQTTACIRVRGESGVIIFQVHRDLLFRHSPYFKKIFQARRSFSKLSKKTRTKIQVKLPYLPNQINKKMVHTIDLPDDISVSPVVFAAYITWLYHGNSMILCMQFPAEVFVQLWVFAGRVGPPALQNDCIEGIERWRAASRMVQTGWLGWIYEHTRGDCGLRRLLIDQCIWEIPSVEWFRANSDDFPDEALVDLAARLLDVVGSAGYLLWADCPFLMAKARVRNYYWIPEPVVG